MVAGAVTLSTSLTFPGVRLSGAGRPIVWKALSVLGVRRRPPAARASLPSLRRPVKRTNRLRHKLLETLKPPFSESDPPPAGRVREDGLQHAGEDEPDELHVVPPPPSDELHAEGHSLVAEIAESGPVIGQSPFLGNASEKGDAFGVFLARSLFLVGLLTLQATLAAWFFRGASGEEKRADAGAPRAEDNNPVVERGKESNPPPGEREAEFNQAVSKIQAMAKEARAAEARKGSVKGGAEGKEGGIMDEVKRRVGKSQKRPPRLHRDARDAGSSRFDETQKVDHPNVPNKEIEENARAHGSSSKATTGPLEQRRSSRGEESTAMTAGPASQSLSPKASSSSASYANGSPDSKQKHAPDQAKRPELDDVGHFWWLKLSYVLAIFLHRGSDDSKFRGLYSLKLNSSSDEGSSSSYAIAFEDRVDASNLCFLLEAFFDNLQDFSADVVPLSTKELYDAVRSDELKVFVVKKGRLRLYAGQPLAEAEMQLHSMMQ